MQSVVVTAILAFFAIAGVQSLKVPAPRVVWPKDGDILGNKGPWPIRPTIEWEKITPQDGETYTYEVSGSYTYKQDDGGDKPYKFSGRTKDTTFYTIFYRYPKINNDKRVPVLWNVRGVSSRGDVGEASNSTFYLIWEQA